MPIRPVVGENYTKFGTSRSGEQFRKVQDTGAKVTLGNVARRYPEPDSGEDYFKGARREQSQTQEEYDAARAEKRQETKAAGGTWDVFAAGSEIGLQRNGSVDERLRVALRNAKLNGNKLTACDIMGQCAIYILTAAGAALVAAKLAGLAGGKKSKRNKSRRNKSRRNKSKHNKSKKNKRRSFRRR